VRPGNAILPNGVVQIANLEIGVPRKVWPASFSARTFSGGLHTSLGKLSVKVQSPPVLLIARTTLACLECRLAM
jgi:hypothetical protein